jgi:hypothetical protein
MVDSARGDLTSSTLAINRWQASMAGKPITHVGEVKHVEEEKPKDDKQEKKKAASDAKSRLDMLAGGGQK